MQQVIGSIVSLLVTIVVVRFLLKRYQPQFVLFTAGVVLMLAAILLGAKPSALLPPKVASSGFILFDIFKMIEHTMSARVAGLGLIIMASGGFAKYMDVIGASAMMVKTVTTPLRRLKAPYLMLLICFFVGTGLKLFIPSASGLSVLLMVTIFPIVVGLGVSPLSGAAMVVTCGSFHLGPASGSMVMGAEYAGISPIVYFLDYQIPAAIPAIIALGVASYLVQKRLDKKHAIGAHFGDTATIAALDLAMKAEEEKAVPHWYVVLPTIPLVLLLVFSEIGVKSIKMDVTLAMLISFAVALTCEALRKPARIKESLKESMAFFDGMGRQFAQVVILIVAAETFAKGLMMTGSIDALIHSAQTAGLGPVGMVIAGTLAIAFATLVMGSSNATFFSFVALAPDIAKTVGFPAINLIMPVHFATSIIANMTPIAAIVVVVSGMANISPFDIMRRTAVPSLVCFVVALVASIIVCARYV